MPDNQDTEFDEQVNESLKKQVSLMRQLGKTVARTVKGSQSLNKQYEKITKVVAKTAKALKPTVKQFARINKEMRSKVIAAYAKTQNVVGNAIKKTTGMINRQTRQLRAQHRQMRQNVRVNRSFTDSFLKATVVIGGLTLAIRTLQKFAQTRIDVSLLGVDLDRLERLLSGSGLRETLTFDLVSQFGALGLPQQFLAQNEVIQKGLVEFQKAFKGLGQERANKLILDLVKIVPEPDRLAKLLTTASTGAVKDALLGARDDRSIGEVFKGLRALTIQRDIEEGKVSPALDAAVKTQQSLDAMSAAVETTSKKLITEFAPAITTAANAMTAAAEKISKLESGTIKNTALIVGGGLLGAKLLSGLIGRKLLTRAIAGGAASTVATQALPVIQGFAARRVAEETVKRTVPRLLGQLTGRAIAAAGAVRLAALGGVAAAAAPVAIGGAIIAQPILDREKLLRQSVDQGQTNERQRSNLFALAKERQRTATTEVDRLRGKRLEIDSVIMGALPDSPVIDKLRAKRNEIVQQIETLIAKQSDLTDQQKKLKIATDKAIKPIESVAKAIETVAQSSAKVDLTSALIRSVQAAPGLQQQTDLQSTITTLRRLERDIAAATPFGQLGALPQLQKLQAEQRQGLKAIQAQLENMIINTPEAEIRANQLRARQLEILLRMRQDTMNLVSSFDLFGKVLGAGGIFSKILINTRSNLGIGRSIGAVRSPLDQIFGSIKGKGLRPRTLQDLGITLPFDILPSPRPKRPARPKRPKFVPDFMAPPRAATPTPPRNIQPQLDALDRETQRAPAITSKREATKDEQRIMNRISARENRIKKLLGAAIEGFQDSGISDSLRRGRQIASSSLRNEQDRQRLERLRQRTVDHVRPTPIKDEIVKRPKAKRSPSKAQAVGGPADKLAQAGKLLIEASRELPEDQIETDDRSVKSGRVLN